MITKKEYESNKAFWSEFIYSNIYDKTIDVTQYYIESIFRCELKYKKYRIFLYVDDVFIEEFIWYKFKTYIYSGHDAVNKILKVFKL
jgi:hypothetical protein